MAVNKFVKETQFTTNQNDLWHAVKAVKKSVSKVSKGAKFSEGLSWSQQLADKVEPIYFHKCFEYLVFRVSGQLYPVILLCAHSP
jgi:hypothetical protein